VASFYLDCNGNGQLDAFESIISSPIFYVQNKKVSTFNTVYSSELAAPTLNQVSSYYKSAADVALKRDSADDWRACVQFNLGTLGPGTGPDPVDLHWWSGNYDDWTEQEHDVTLVEVLEGAIGFTYTGKILIDWDDGPHDTFTHEVGHKEGLGHNDTDTRNIMHTDAPSPTTRLTEGEADHFNN
jgi:hypothetical protein